MLSVAASQAHELRRDIQMLRGVAAFIVVLFHLQMLFFSTEFLGVDTFFVISLFMMATLHDKGTVGHF